MNTRFNPLGWKRPKGYANVISAKGRLVSVAGQIGWNEMEEFTSDNFVDQVKQALRNVKACLQVADAAPEHLVRLTWYITDKQEYLGALVQVGEIYRQILGKNFPVMTMVEVSALIEPRAKVEIEATAIVPD